MNIEELRDFCLSLGDDVEEKTPFTKFKGGDSVLVFYVSGHMFCFFDMDQFEVVSVKCQPERIVTLREEHLWLCDPINESDKHWLGIRIREADNDMVRQLVSNSYEIVKAKYQPKPRKKTIGVSRS